MDNQKRVAVVTATNTPGFYLLKSEAELILQSLVEQAMDDEDDNKSNALRREAKGAKKFWTLFLNRIESLRSPENDEEPAGNVGDSDEWHEVADS